MRKSWLLMVLNPCKQSGVHMRNISGTFLTENKEAIGRIARSPGPNKGP